MRVAAVHGEPLAKVGKSVPKTDGFGTLNFYRSIPLIYWVGEPSFLEGFRNGVCRLRTRAPHCPTLREERLGCRMSVHYLAGGCPVRLPARRRSGVVRKPDDRWGEVPVAFVYCNRA